MKETNLLTKNQIEDLLNYIGVDKVQFWKGDKIQFCCPIHGERHPSCGINAAYQKGFHSPVIQVFNCFSCHESGDLVWFLFKSLPDKFRSVNQARLFLENRYGVNFKMVTKLKRKSSINKYEDLFVNIADNEKKILPKTRLAIFKSGKETYSYYYKRGFDKKDLVEYKVGRDLDNKTVTFPVFYEDGQLAGIIGRYIDPHRRYGERFKIYDGFERGQLIYPIDKLETIDDTLIMVESIIDCQLVRKWGIKNVFALMGSSLTNTQANLIKERCRRVIDLLDNDYGGEMARIKARKKLSNSVMYLTIDYPDKVFGKDPSEWGEKLTKNALTTASLCRNIRRY